MTLENVFDLKDVVTLVKICRQKGPLYIVNGVAMQNKKTSSFMLFNVASLVW